MTYQVLARKWRPRIFRKMAGQEHVLKALINALENKRLHHAYLFTGTRGVGKTTIGRILAKCLNCRVGVSSEPCDQCDACVAINEGHFIDLIEVDAASKTKVEDTRDLLNNVQYAPASGRYKVYLIDEVHMLSNSSFNALLKTLEEPPPHVKFLLATTDPQKLPATILSRCLQFNLKHINPEQIVEYLKIVLANEMIPFEDAALWQLARAANGSMRDALSLTDQAIAFGNGKITEDDSNAMLGTIDRTIVYDLLAALSDNDGSGLLSTVAKLAEFSSDFTSVLAELLVVLHRIAVAQALPDAIDDSLGDRQQILANAQCLTAEDVQLFYQIALLGKKDLPLAPDPRGGLEMVLLRMLTFKLEDIGDLPKINVKMKTETKKKTELPAQLSVKKSHRDAPESMTTPTIQASTPTMAQEHSNNTGLLSLSQPPQTVISTKKIPFAEFTPNNWLQVYFGLNAEGLLQTTVANCVFSGRQTKTLVFTLDEGHSALYDENHQQRLAVLLINYFDEILQVRINIDKTEPNRETPAAYIARCQRQRMAKAEATITNDTLVNQLIKQFNAEIVQGSITPVDH